MVILTLIIDIPQAVNIKFTFNNRILLQYCEEFSSEKKAVPKHIQSKYSSEMAKNSKTVRLLIITKFTTYVYLYLYNSIAAGPTWNSSLQ